MQNNIILEYHAIQHPLDQEKFWNNSNFQSGVYSGRCYWKGKTKAVYKNFILAAQYLWSIKIKELPKIVKVEVTTNKSSGQELIDDMLQGYKMVDIIERNYITKANPLINNEIRDAITKELGNV